MAMRIGLGKALVLSVVISACGSDGSDMTTADSGLSDDASPGGDRLDGGPDASDLDASPMDDGGTPDAEIPDAEVPDAAPPRGTFASAYSVLEKHCAFCHVQGGIGLVYGRLDLSTPEAAYAELILGKAAGFNCWNVDMTYPDMRYVTPGDVENSLLINKIDDESPVCGIRMPDKYADLSEKDIALIQEWIETDTEAQPVIVEQEQEPTIRDLLSQTGLFQDLAVDETLAAGVREFHPKYALWSDGATKRRWLYLPPGTKIDTSDMDFWVYPVGTKVWKEFTRDGVRIETRLLEKTAAGWGMVAYRWRDGVRKNEEAEKAAGFGEYNVRGTQHDIPSVEECKGCHSNMKDKLLGLSAIQLSHSESGVTLQTLIDEDLLTDPPAAPFVLPGGAKAATALGYLHANCGHCHNAQSPLFEAMKKRPLKTGGPELWERTGKLSSVGQTVGYLSTVGQASMIRPALHIIEAGDSANSALILRMSDRGLGGITMPPIGTEILDDKDPNNGLPAVKAWIDSLP